MDIEADMMHRLLGFATAEPRVRMMTLEGSRANPNVPRDRLQDFDISFFVTDRDHFRRDDGWLDAFGARLMMQTPEDMELFPPDLEIGFSYIILLENGLKLDLTLYTLDEADTYFRISDGLVQLLLDKDDRAGRDIVANDRQYWISQPSARSFDDCCNEYWMVSTYVTKGLLRGELLFAVDHLHAILRPNLLRMMAWWVGSEHGYGFSVGKNYKYLDRYVPASDWQQLVSTLRMDGADHVARALSTCHALFRIYSARLATRLGYRLPDYDDAVARYTDRLSGIAAAGGVTNDD